MNEKFTCNDEQMEESSAPSSSRAQHGTQAAGPNFLVSLENKPSRVCSQSRSEASSRRCLQLSYDPDPILPSNKLAGATATSFMKQKHTLSDLNMQPYSHLNKL